ncbi:PKD domain-containing protein [Vibrio alfacsensis]|uniref:PKD domain-containing protein n=1 Tax=Vibrio TaxID=662 RepID=UPI00406899A2
MYKTTWTTAIALALVGCGGGSDGSDGSSSNTLRVYSTTSSVNVTGNSMDYTYATVGIDSTGVVEEGSSVYIGVLEDTGGLLNAAEMHFITDQSGDYILEFKPGYLLQDGENESVVSLAFCYDEYCKQHVNGSPIKVNVDYSNDLREEIALGSTSPQNLSKTAALNETGLDNDPVVFTAYVTGSNADRITLRHQHDHNVASHVTFENRGNSIYQLTADVRLPTSLKVGEHVSSLKIDACYDEECLYPIKGSPLTIPMNYQVTGPVFEPDSPAAVNESQELPFHVKDAKHIPGLDIIVMSSDSPVNAVYVYDIASNTTYTYPLSDRPESLSVDLSSTQGRIVVGHEFKVTQIDYNPDYPETPLKITHTTSVENPMTIVKNDWVYLVERFDGFSEYTRLNLPSSQEALMEGPSLRQMSVFEVHPSGHGIYFTSNAFYPQDIGRTNINETLALDYDVDSPYHGDYAIGDDFWFSYDGTQLYTSSGNIFTTSNNPDEDMVYAGALPLAPIESNISSVAQNEGVTLLADSYPSYTIRKLNNATMLVEKTYPKTTRNVNGEGGGSEHEIDEEPIFVFISDRGYVYTIKETNYFPEFFYRLERLD